MPRIDEPLQIIKQQEPEAQKCISCQLNLTAPLFNVVRRPRPAPWFEPTMSKPVAPDNTARKHWRRTIGEANNTRCDGFMQTQRMTFGSSCQGTHPGYTTPDDEYLFYAIRFNLQALTGILRECPLILLVFHMREKPTTDNDKRRLRRGRNRQAAALQPPRYSARSKYAAIFARTFRPRRTFASAVLPADFRTQCTYGLDSSRAV